MHNLFNVNGLIFWDAQEIRIRKFIQNELLHGVSKILLAQNSAWNFHEIEAPLLTPSDLINPNYTSADIWVQSHSHLTLRPETTASSYAYVDYLLNSNLAKPPLIVWQSGKSFRREQDQVTKNMRLKEFYQQEFQCVYAADTLNDYQEAVYKPLADLVQSIIALPTRVVDSDRLPSYSMRTLDIEVKNSDKWMEVCSISKRTDLTTKATFAAKNKTIVKDLLVLEIAFGLDRLVYNYNQRAHHES